jgi:AraC family transcriptional regulator
MATGPGGPRGEYLSRIHAVQDYIERHLGSALRLEELARVARISPFHFHRLYRSLTGESLYQFILRLRLERAAWRLLSEPEEPVTNISLDCGFGSWAAFARAFKAKFGTSASQWRTDSKIREANRKNEKDTRGDLADDRAVRSTEVTETTLPSKPASSVRVETIAPVPVVYLRHTGPYAGDSALFQELFGRLLRWAGARGLVRFPETKLMAVYHDNPEITEQENLRVSVCMSVPPGTAGSGEVNSMEIPGGKYAKALFELDVTEYQAAWNWVYCTWLPSSGYQPDDRPGLENYLNNPDEHPEKKHVVELWIPVKPL